MPYSPFLTAPKLIDQFLRQRSNSLLTIVFSLKVRTDYTQTVLACKYFWLFCVHIQT
jgi:hypothetical protein